MRPHSTGTQSAGPRLRLGRQAGPGVGARGSTYAFQARRVGGRTVLGTESPSALDLDLLVEDGHHRNSSGWPGAGTGMSEHRNRSEDRPQEQDPPAVGVVVGRARAGAGARSRCENDARAAVTGWWARAFPSSLIPDEAGRNDDDGRGGRRRGVDAIGRPCGGGMGWPCGGCAGG